MNKHKPGNSSFDPLVISGEAEIAAEAVIIPHAEQARVLARPQTVESFWVENEYDELEDEQRHLWSATGSLAAQPQVITGAQAGLAATEMKGIVTAHAVVVADAQARILRTAEVLAPFRRRAKGTKYWYQAAKAGFLFGDVAGFGTAAIWLGELPVVAITLATSAAVATVAAGLIGVDVRDRELRRQRHHAVTQPSAAQQEFPHLFTADSGGGVLKRMLLVAATTAGTIGVGIAALRSAVDDPLIGLVFGGIAMAVAGGSFLVSYTGADEVADLIEHAHADYARAVKTHIRYSDHARVREHAAADAVQSALQSEHASRGLAAASRVRSLKWGILRRNPSHAGHGTASHRMPTSVVGQTARREVVGS